MSALGCGLLLCHFTPYLERCHQNTPIALRFMEIFDERQWHFCGITMFKEPYYYLPLCFLRWLHAAHLYAQVHMKGIKTL